MDRKRRHHKRPLSLHVVADSVVQTLQQKTRSTALQAPLLCLPDRQQQAFILRNIEGLANPKIASVMVVTVKTVKSLMACGKRAWGKQLTDQCDALGFKMTDKDQVDAVLEGFFCSSPQRPTETVF